MKISLLFVLIGVSLAFSSCNTIAGVGEDISSGGRTLNEAATSTKDKM